MIALGLCQVHYEALLLIIFLIDFRAINAHDSKSSLEYASIKVSQLIVGVLNTIKLMENKSMNILLKDL